MTYITKYLPSLENLKKELENNPEAIQYYVKYQGYHGDVDTINYLETQIKKYYESKKN
jgi:hypothetical protein